jgi:alpha-glucosidase
MPRVDGATDFQIFVKIILPLSFPALASFAIFQFLWTWNDLLVALVFLGTGNDQLVLTGNLVNLMGSRGGDWEILAASAFVSIAVPLIGVLLDAAVPRARPSGRLGQSEYDDETAKDPDWWRGAVIYQIYPRSFQDTTATASAIWPASPSGCAYRRLGADAIWISPFFTSPMKDFGYDVSDYRDVDPMFGTLADFDRWWREGAQPGPAGDDRPGAVAHLGPAPLVQESRKSRRQPAADWYVWADPKPDGTPPNNWLSIFGGSAWQWDSRREQYYLHNFLTSQPDLNFHNRRCRMRCWTWRFWLERGVDGFRLDTINFYFHDRHSARQSGPARGPSATIHRAQGEPLQPPAAPVFDKSQPENLDFLRRFRAVLNPYGAAAVGEVGDSQRGLEIMAEYTSGGDKVQMCYPFELLQPRR